MCTTHEQINRIRTGSLRRPSLLTWWQTRSSRRARGDYCHGDGIWWLGIDHRLHGSDGERSRMVAVRYEFGLCLVHGGDGGRRPDLGTVVRSYGRARTARNRCHGHGVVADRDGDRSLFACVLHCSCDLRRLWLFGTVLSTAVYKRRMVSGAARIGYGARHSRGSPRPGLAPVLRQFSHSRIRVAMGFCRNWLHASSSACSRTTGAEVATRHKGTRGHHHREFRSRSVRDCDRGLF